MWVQPKYYLWGAILPLLVSTAVAQEVPAIPAAPAPPTLWSFLGIPQGARKVHGALFNTRGNRPNLEKKPPLKAIGDPENLKSKNDAIKQAAKVKQEEDLKPQKIKAIKYLASIGCGCYDKDGEITKALIAAAEDCTEEVRVTTMDELHKVACGKCCAKCGMTCCCKEPLLKKLAEIAYAKDEFGCCVEPSQRVREGALKVLQACCPSAIPPLMEPEKKPEEKKKEPEAKKTPPKIEGEGEKTKPKEEIKGEKSGDEEPKEDENKSDDTKSDDKKKDDKPASDEKVVRLRLSDKTPAKLVGSEGLRLTASSPAAIINPDIQLNSSPNPDGGVVIGYDPTQRLAYVHFEDSKTIVPVGSSVYIRVDPSRGKGYRGLWTVVATARGRANLVPQEVEEGMLILPGDHVMFGEPPVTVAPVGFIQP